MCVTSPRLAEELDNGAGNSCCGRDDRLPPTRARSIFESLGSEIDEARTLNELGRLLRQTGEDEKASTVLLHALDLTADDVEMVTRASIHRELGLVEARRHFPTGEKHLREAIALFERAGSAFELLKTRRALGDLFFERGDIATTCDEYRAAMAFAEHSSVSEV